MSLTNADSETLRAALEKLEADRERMIEERIERGEVIRAPLVVVGASESIDAAYNRAVARLRAAGEKREVVCPKYEMRDDGELREAISVIITGVPRAGRDENYTRPDVSEPPAPAVCDRRSAPREPRAQEQPTARNDATTDNETPEIRRIWTQVEQPSQANPAGEIAEGSYRVEGYRVEGGLLTVEDAQGRLLGRQAVGPGDDVETIARKLLREKTRGSDFYRSLYH